MHHKRFFPFRQLKRYGSCSFITRADMLTRISVQYNEFDRSARGACHGLGAEHHSFIVPSWTICFRYCHEKKRVFPPNSISVWRVFWQCFPYNREWVVNNIEWVVNDIKWVVNNMERFIHNTKYAMWAISLIVWYVSFGICVSIESYRVHLLLRVGIYMHVNCIPFQ